MRDLLLGREPKDFDVVTNATPEEVKKVFRNAFLIGRRFRIAHVRFQGEIIEVATFRALQPPAGEATEETVEAEPEVAPEPVAEENLSEEEPEEGENRKGRRPRRRPELPVEGRLQSDDGLILRDNVWGSPEEDAFRRDFTVNALFYNIADFSIIDYAGGLKDLEAGRLRLIGDPETRYREDPVRMLRAVRFAAKLGFTIDADSLSPITSLKEEILKSHSARLYEELQKLWISEESERGYQLMRSTGLFGVLFPEVENWLSVEEETYPHTFTGKALQWIEDELREGRKITPALLFAILLSGPIMARAEELQEKAGGRFPVTFAAAKEIVEQVRDRISLPKRDVESIKAILYGEQRFPQTRGKRPHTWRRNPNFGDSFRYFSMKAKIEGNGGELLQWWEKFLETGGVVESEREKRSVKKKRRRRFRKPPSAGEKK